MIEKYRLKCQAGSAVSRGESLGYDIVNIIGQGF